MTVRECLLRHACTSLGIGSAGMMEIMEGVMYLRSETCGLWRDIRVMASRKPMPVTARWATACCEDGHDAKYYQELIDFVHEYSAILGVGKLLSSHALEQLYKMIIGCS